MASYLPVLLATVSSNANDDSAVSTLPRGQVDYLSHDWQEEDVWRSWRNMTRQKNDIANGMRLENASWRTWWKQRNKLKTISPETLNWLKDSDVTWLYGPLHTAVEWAPPPRKSTVTPNDHLDLSQPKHKPILKHRNLSEFLTSDYTHSPLWSPVESDDDDDDDSADADFPRPALPQIKSDTHITRWGPNRAFRKDSPPRVDPPSGLKPQHAYSGTNLKGYFDSHQNGPPQVLSPSPSPPSTDTAAPTAHHKKKSRHITFNTFVEQCISIDKPKSRSTSRVRSGWDGRTGTKGVNWDVNYQDVDDDDIEDFGDEQGYDEDVESSDEGDWKHPTDGDNEFAICTDSEESDIDINSPYHPSNDSDEDDENIIEIRSSHRPSIAAQRSHSKSSNSSASTSSASDSGSRRRSYTATARRRNSSSASTLRPGSKTLSSSSSSSSSTTSLPNFPTAPSVTTIAPIAPTRLKVGGSDAWDGFGVHQHTNRTPWLESFGDESWSDEGYGGYGAESVELVYVPKAIQEGEEETYQHQGAYFSIGDADTDMDLAYGDDYFGRSNHHRTRRHEPQEDSNGGQEERVEMVDPSPPSSNSPTPMASPKITRPSQPIVTPTLSPAPPPTPTPVNIPMPVRPASPPSQVIQSVSSSSSLLSPPTRGRSTEQLGDSPRGRSLTRTPSWTSDSERSRSMGGSSTSPMGSLSPDGSGSVGVVVGSVSASGRIARDSQQDRKRRRREGNRSDSSGSSLSPEAGSSTSVPSPPPAPPASAPTPNAFDITEEPRDPPRTAPTPSNSPERKLAALRSPILSTKRSASVEETHHDAVRTPSHHSTRPTSMRRDSSEGDGASIMGRMVNSAGSYLGLWN